MRVKKIPELLCPVSGRIGLKAALDSGADAVYFGIKELNMRANAKNFELSELKAIASKCHEKGVKAYLALNTIIFEDELKKVDKICLTAKKAGIDAVILWDLGALMIAKKHGLEIHLSTQASVSNSVSANFFKDNGIKRIILARECSLEMIKKIKKKSGVEIEVFVHGAMCVAISGRCFLSHSLFNRSANRGDCLQPCRREYIIQDPEEKHSLRLGKDYVMSPKDLCTIELIDKIIEAGVDSIKIEGRMRKPEYIKTVTSCYRRALDLYKVGKLDDDIKKEMLKEVEKVYNRGFSKGFLLNKPAASDFSENYGSSSKERKQYIGKVENYYRKINVAEIKIESGKMRKGDKIMFQGEKTGVQEQIIDTIEIDHIPVDAALKGKNAAIKVKKKVRENDKVYLLVKRE